MNMSRSRRLILLLSYAYLEQEWCSSNFRWGCGFFSVPPHDVSVAVTLRHAFSGGASCTCWRCVSIPPSSSCWRVSPNAWGPTSSSWSASTTTIWLYSRGGTTPWWGFQRRWGKLPATSQRREEKIMIDLSVLLLPRFLLLSSGRS